MSGNIWDDLHEQFKALERRADQAVDIGFTAMKGLTWDALTKGKNPNQVKEEIEQLAANYEEMERNRRIG
jgi:hypothetical protein